MAMAMVDSSTARMLAEGLSVRFGQRSYGLSSWDSSCWPSAPDSRRRNGGLTFKTFPKASPCRSFSLQTKFKRFSIFPSHTRQEVEKRIKFLKEFASETMPSVIGEAPELDHPFNNRDIPPHALAWSMAAVSSRAFSVHNSRGGSSLLPLVNMCNHSFAPTGRLVQHPSSSHSLPVLEVIAEKDLEKGEHVVLNYGPLSNDMLLLDYGFVMPNNPHDRVELRYDGQLLDLACLVAKLESSCSFKPPASWQQELLGRLNLHGPGSSQLVTMGGTELVEGRLLAAVRLMHAQDSRDIDLEALQVWHQTPALGIENERKAIRTLIGLGMLALTSFPTVIQEDESDLVKGGNSENLCLAIQFRMLKKRLLLDTIKALKARCPT